MKAFYKGNVAALTGVILRSPLQFGINEVAKRTVKVKNKLAKYLICGALAGLGNSFVSTPVELVRMHLQNQSSVTDPRLRYRSATHVLRSLTHQYGIMSIYKGYKITLIREIAAMSTFFGVYETLKHTFTDPKKPKNLPLLMLMGSASGVLSWIPALPLDVLKTKIQLDSFSGPIYKNIRHVVKLTYRQQGLAGFFSGLSPILARTLITSAVCMGTFEVTMNFLTGQRTKYSSRYVLSINDK